jgi:hypothetical protein
MATTTPNYGWAVPTSTDLVKDGATAIETLGDAIDASMNTALGTKKAGMVLLNTTSFSGVASQSINTVFSATYTNYQILLTLSAVSNDTNVSLRLRTGGADASGSNYNVGGLEIMTTATGPNLYRRQNDTSAFFMNVDAGQSSDYYSTRFDLFNPFNAKRTTGVFQSMASTQAGTFASYVGGINHTLETSYDSITFFPEAGTFSGTISIYGVNK